MLDLNDMPAYYITGTIKANTVDSPADRRALDARATKVTLKVDNAGAKRKPYLRMPLSCPKGKWTASGTNTFSGGVKETCEDDRSV